jgi:hypothetical protein
MQPAGEVLGAWLESREELQEWREQRDRIERDEQSEAKPKYLIN